ncbi:YggS family pyridoxal phosphate-dependent enzyme [Haloferula sp. A504]|uniref:YggS family pyridoxal phosphate-dependent enzyme n=1 Tax=Haloferula sp. A504 TaxID=3373601 RepID=UPI0031C927BE|nr:YggS family pyridoxal phosphate-dependent enzyme [Verrucomicrobiaceae bacterium E54]
MPEIAARLAEIRRRMDAACRRASRSVEEVTLLAVSKTFPAAVVAEASEAGQRHFGESRQQEGCAKVEELPASLNWHFIGRLQRNKVRKVLPAFPVLHSIDSLRLAAHVDRIAGELGLKPSVYLEVDLAGEDSKGGFSEAELEAAIHEVGCLSNLSIVGLMAIPPAVDDPEDSRPWFARARELRDALLPDGGLSMGMSGDFEVAIEEGSTIVRVGSSIFGRREAAQ